jgi:hypothetical protein
LWWGTLLKGSESKEAETLEDQGPHVLLYHRCVSQVKSKGRCSEDNLEMVGRAGSHMLGSFQEGGGAAGCGLDRFLQGVNSSWGS